MSYPRPTTEQMIERLAHLQRRRIPGRHWMARAAVAAVLCDDADKGVSVLLMQRAIRDGDPWSGHMSFPGGRLDRNEDSVTAAIRETYEETGLELSTDDQVGSLSDVLTRRHERRLPMVVTPHVFVIDRFDQWQLNHEAESTLWVPLSFLADRGNRRIMRWKAAGMTWKLSCYFYQEHRIWGLTLLMLRELLRVYRNQQPSG